jgi:nucleoid-associated protein YgaU
MGLADTALQVVHAGMDGAPVVAEDALLALVAGVAEAVLGWLALGVVLEVLATLPGVLGRTARTVSAAVSPRIVRRGAAVVLGIGLGAGLGAGPTAAAQSRSAYAAVHDAVAAAAPAATPGDAGHLPDPAWRPLAPDPGPRGDDRVASHPDVTGGSAAPRRQRVTTTTDEVVVRRGDSLWVIAARHLGGAASNRVVADEWPRWYAVNRQVIGPDPDLIVPGQVLRQPPAEDHP